MGEAKRRGTFDERRARAMTKKRNGPIPQWSGKVVKRRPISKVEAALLAVLSGLSGCAEK